MGRNGCVETEILNDRAQQKILLMNGRKLNNINSIVTVRKVGGRAYSHCRYYDDAHSKEIYSDILFKINKIPFHWNTDDVVKYFAVSCNAPLRSCYRLNQDNDDKHNCTQYVFVEFRSPESAKRARNILERNIFQNCLGIIPIQKMNVGKISRYHPTYTI